MKYTEGVLFRRTLRTKKGLSTKRPFFIKYFIPRLFPLLVGLRL